MPDLLKPVLDALDDASAALTCFVRDDDAGWDDAKLFALLDHMERAQVPIDLAAIPFAIGGTLQRELNARIDATPYLLHVHQHGYAHVNHEREGRKCEFGPMRGRAAQRNDLARGRRLLQRHFGARLEPLFTPPWNRCAADTPALLVELGYAALSRDRGSATQQAIPELSVDVDWCKHAAGGGAAGVAEALGTAVHARIVDGKPLGLMLHHAAMASDEMALLEQWLVLLNRHPQVRWSPMAQLIENNASCARGFTADTEMIAEA